MFPRLIFPAFLLVAAFNLTSPLRAEPSAATLHVEQDITGEPKVVKFQRTQKRALIISVTNTSNAPLDVVVKHIIFGRDVLKREVVVVAQGDHPLKIAPLATEKFETVSGSAVAVETHFDISTKKMIQGSGATIVGQGVQVLQGGTVITESYEPPSMKEEWGKAAPLTAGAAATPAPAAKATPAAKQ